jgi:hypothetical protein
MMKRDLSVFVAMTLMSFVLRPALAAEPPAVAISAKMGDVTDELNRKQTGKPVQTEQKAIVDDLDKLIASLEKKYENNRNGLKRNDPNRGMEKSEIRRGTGGVGDLVNPKDSAKDWAKLSARERDRIMQSMSEGFPPEYRLVLERYYRRLADEKRSPAAGEPAAAKQPDASKEADENP